MKKPGLNPLDNRKRGDLPKAVSTAIIEGRLTIEKKLLCIGHRGAMGHAPENTIVSIEKALGAYSVHLPIEFVDRRLVEDAHRRGLRIFVFTVNLQEDIMKMEALGVDGVFTDYPERVLDRLEDKDITIGWH